MSWGLEFMLIRVLLISSFDSWQESDKWYFKMYDELYLIIKWHLSLCTVVIHQYFTIRTPLVSFPAKGLKELTQQSPISFFSPHLILY